MKTGILTLYCERCGKKFVVINTTQKEALRQMKEAGWKASQYQQVCPECVKGGRNP